MFQKENNIWKRKDGRWEGRYPIEKKENGTIKYRSVYGKTYSEAKEKLAAQLKKSGFSPGKALTFSAVLEEWLLSNSFTLKASTKLKYENIINGHIKPSLGEYPLSEITPVIISNFLESKHSDGRLDQQGGLSLSYVKTMFLIIQSTHSYCVAQGYCAPIVFSMCKVPVEHKKMFVLSADEQKQLEEKLLIENTIDGLGIILALNTGLRIGEICALRWEDVDMENGIIHVQHTVARVKNNNPAISGRTTLILDTPKTKTSCREIPITKKVKEVLNKSKEISKSSYIISSSDSFVSPRTYEYRFHKKLQACEMQQINFHALRHTFATRCIEKGVDVKTLSEILGHSNIGITLNTYVHSSMDFKRIQLEKLD